MPSNAPIEFILEGSQIFPAVGRDQGRLLRRSFHAASLERVKGYRDTLAFKRAMRKRSIWVEGLFAEAKQWHGLHRFRLRGLVNVNIQALLVAAGQNLKRWFQATGWGHRGFPGAAFAPFGELATTSGTSSRLVGMLP